MPTVIRSSARTTPYSNVQSDLVALIAANFIKHLFNYEDPATVLAPTAPDLVPLSSFIKAILKATEAYAYRCAFAALYYIQRLRYHMDPYQLKGSAAGHMLFLVTYVLAIKTLVDDVVAFNRPLVDWLGPNGPTLKQFNTLEQAVCRWLNFQLNVPPEALADFEDRVRHDYDPYRTTQDTYSEYILPDRNLSPADAPQVVWRATFLRNMVQIEPQFPPGREEWEWIQVDPSKEYASS